MKIICIHRLHEKPRVHWLLCLVVWYLYSFISENYFKTYSYGLISKTSCYFIKLCYFIVYQLIFVCYLNCENNSWLSLNRKYYYTIFTLYFIEKLAILLINSARFFTKLWSYTYNRILTLGVRYIYHYEVYLI